jgi:hypothetical protein
LREVAQGVSVRTKLLLQHGAERARLDVRRSARSVDVDDAVHGGEVDRHRPPPLVADARLDPTDDGRAAAVGDCCDALGRAPVEKLDDLRFVRGERHDVGWVGQVAAERANDIAVGLAERV